MGLSTTYTKAETDFLIQQLEQKTSDKYTDDTLAGDILKRVDINTGENVNYRETTTWYDGSAMDDSKTDGFIYVKKGLKYFKNTISKKADLTFFGGKYDDENFDNSKAIQLAIDLGYQLEISGKCYVSGLINLRKNTTITGSSISNPKWTDGDSVIIHNPTSSKDLFINEAVQSGYGYLAGININNLTIKGNANSRYCLNLNSVANSNFSHLYIDTFKEAMHLEYLMNVSFNLVNAAECDIALRFTGSISTTVVFNECYLHFSRWGAIMEHETCLGIVFRNTIIESCTEGGIDIHTDNVVDFISLYTENVPREKVGGVPIIQIGINGVEKNIGYPIAKVTFTGGNLAGCNFGIDANSVCIKVGRVALLSFFGTSFNRAARLIDTTQHTKLVTFNSCTVNEVTNLYAGIFDRSKVSFNFINSINTAYIQSEQKKASFLGTSRWNLIDEFRQTDSDLVLRKEDNYVAAINANNSVNWGADKPMGNVTNAFRIGVTNDNWNGATYDGSSHYYSKMDGNGLIHFCWKDSSGREYMDGITTCTTNERPIYNFAGRMIYDLGLKKPIFWDGTNWKDAVGNIV